MPKNHPIALAKERLAFARMYIGLTLALRNVTNAAEPDANRVLIAAAVMLGHASEHPMNESEIAACVRMPRQSVHRRLQVLVKRGLIVQDRGRYYLTPYFAENTPHKDAFDLILAQAFEALGPYLLNLGI